VAAATKLRAPALLFAVGIALLPVTAHAWDGTDEDGNSVEIESGNLVRPGNDIEVYHSKRGYGTYSVETIQRNGSIVELEVYDHETGEYQTFEMED
jgi:Family of unknown function (DUF5334)